MGGNLVFQGVTRRVTGGANTVCCGCEGRGLELKCVARRGNGARAVGGGSKRNSLILSQRIADGGIGTLTVGGGSESNSLILSCCVANLGWGRGCSRECCI